MVVVVVVVVDAPMTSSMPKFEHPEEDEEDEEDKDDEELAGFDLAPPSLLGIDKRGGRITTIVRACVPVVVPELAVGWW